MGRDRVHVDYPVQVRALQAGQALESCGGEMESPRGSEQVGGVRNGGRQPLAFQVRHGVVSGAVGSAGDGGQLQPVDEGHGGQPPHRRKVPFHGAHGDSPSPESGFGGLGFRERPLCFLGGWGEPSWASVFSSPFPGSLTPS